MLLSRNTIVAFLLLSLMGCSGQDPIGTEQEVVEEKFPNVNLNDYDSVQVEDLYQLIVPKSLFPTKMLNDRARFQYNQLSKEKHVYIIDETKATFVSSLEARKIDFSKDLLLLLFAKERLQDMKGLLDVKRETKLEQSIVNGHRCCRVELDADVYGFPKTKSYFMRFIEGKKNFYTVVSWTVKGVSGSFRDEAYAMGLSFNEL